MNFERQLVIDKFHNEARIFLQKFLPQTMLIGLDHLSLRVSSPIKASIHLPALSKHAREYHFSAVTGTYPTWDQHFMIQLEMRIFKYYKLYPDNPNYIRDRFSDFLELYNFSYDEKCIMLRALFNAIFSIAIYMKFFKSSFRVYRRLD